MPYADILRQAAEAADRAARFIRAERGKFATNVFETKSNHSFVTHVDRQAEEMLYDALHRIVPQAGFLGEEGGERAAAGNEFLWIVDPLDGTTNYVHGLWPVAVSVALFRDGQPVVGVVHEVGRDEQFRAALGQGAYLGNSAIQVSGVRNVADALLALGFPYYDYDRMAPLVELMQHLMQYSHGLRRLGSAATDLAYVACGRCDGFFEYGLSPWDVAAGAFIVREAGGAVCDFGGGADYVYGKEIVAANALIFDELKTLVGRYMRR